MRVSEGMTASTDETRPRPTPRRADETGRNGERGGGTSGEGWDIYPHAVPHGVAHVTNTTAQATTGTNTLIAASTTRPCVGKQVTGPGTRVSDTPGATYT